MSITYEWKNVDQTVVMVTFDGTWTWDDFHNRFEEIHRLVATVEHPVDLLLWHKVSYPYGNPLIHFNQIARQQPSNVQNVFLVAGSSNNAVKSFFMALSKIVKKLQPTKSSVTILGSLEEAEKLLGLKVTPPLEATTS